VIGNDQKDNVETAKEKLLDPFEPVFPMPGMWHFAFAMILAIVAFFGAMVVLLDYMLVDPKVQFFVVVAASIMLTAILTASIKGFLWATNILKFIAVSPLAIVIINVLSNKESSNFVLVVFALALIAILLMLTKKFRALINILTIRRHKISQMKNDGTYKKKLDEARRRWKVK
jgi:hypothetical protein